MEGEGGTKTSRVCAGKREREDNTIGSRDLTVGVYLWWHTCFCCVIYYINILSSLYLSVCMCSTGVFRVYLMDAVRSMYTTRHGEAMKKGTKQRGNSAPLRDGGRCRWASCKFRLCPLPYVSSSFWNVFFLLMRWIQCCEDQCWGKEADAHLYPWVFA